MKTTLTKEVQDILNQRFHHDSLISLATAADNIPHVRTVNSFYEDGSFYVVTYALSGKMKQIAQNPAVAISGDWFTAQGLAENLGHVLAAENAPMMAKLREAFASWYANGHVNEADPNTCLLRIRLTDGVLMNHGTRYDIDFIG